MIRDDAAPFANATTAATDAGVPVLIWDSGDQDQDQDQSKANVFIWRGAVPSEELPSTTDLVTLGEIDNGWSNILTDTKHGTRCTRPLYDRCNEKLNAQEDTLDHKILTQMRSICKEKIDECKPLQESNHNQKVALLMSNKNRRGDTSQQAFHTDLPSAGFGYSFFWALMDDTRLHFMDDVNKKVMTVTFNAGDLLCFAGDVLHAGAAYDDFNLRVHAYYTNQNTAEAAQACANTYNIQPLNL